MFCSYLKIDLNFKISILNVLGLSDFEPEWIIDQWATPCEWSVPIQRCDVQPEMSCLGEFKPVFCHCMNMLILVMNTILRGLPGS